MNELPEYNATNSPEAADSENISRGLSSSTLKLIAIISMLIDHFAAGFLLRYINSGAPNAELWNLLYTCMRCAGRLAFPIYCFTLVEGFYHTRSVKKYALRLLAFCAISELPFDYCFFGKIYTGYQNVFFTLFIGLLTIAALDFIKKKDYPKSKWIVLSVLCSAVGMGTAFLLHTDYQAMGVFCIVILYLFHDNKQTQLIAGGLAFLFEFPFAQLAFLPISFYNQKRGINIKYLLYAFYPVHLALIYALVCLCHLQSFPSMG